jgi:hypothetical protein
MRADLHDDRIGFFADVDFAGAPWAPRSTPGGRAQRRRSPP